MGIRIEREITAVDNEAFISQKHFGFSFYQSCSSPYAISFRLRVRPNKDVQWTKAYGGSKKRKALDVSELERRELSVVDVYDVWNAFHNIIDKKVFSPKERRAGLRSPAFGVFHLGDNTNKFNPHIHFYLDNKKLLPYEEFLGLLNYSWCLCQKKMPFASAEMLDIRNEVRVVDEGWSDYFLRKHFSFVLSR